MRLRHKKNLDSNGVQTFAYVFLSIMTVIFIFPLVRAVLVSFSDENSIL